MTRQAMPTQRAVSFWVLAPQRNTTIPAIAIVTRQVARGVTGVVS